MVRLIFRLLAGRIPVPTAHIVRILSCASCNTLPVKIEEGLFMEPIDTDFDYVAQQSRKTDLRARFNWLYILPVLGVCWVLFLILAVIFEWPLSGVVDSIMVLIVLLFAVIVALLFWSMAPKTNRE
jgi:hypothetical protein